MFLVNILYFGDRTTIAIQFVENKIFGKSPFIYFIIEVTTRILEIKQYVVSNDGTQLLIEVYNFNSSKKYSFFYVKVFLNSNKIITYNL